MPARVALAHATHVVGSESELIGRLRRGDASAFREVWDAYHPRLLSFATRRTDSADTAADVVQQVFVALWDEHETFSPRTTLVAWLFKATHLRTLSVLRATRDARRRESDWELEDLSSTASADPAARVELSERLVIVRAIVQTMSPRGREIFLLSRRDGLRPAEIASLLGLRPQVVYNQLSAALRALASGLADE